MAAQKCFLTENLDNKSSSCKTKNYKKIKSVRGFFQSKVKSELRYNTGKHKTTYSVDVKNISQLFSSKHFILPKKLLNIQGYNMD